MSVRRAVGSAETAAELLHGALSALGADLGLAAALARAAGGACRFMEQHSPERQYHLTIGVTGERCTVTCADYEDSAPLPQGARARADERGIASALLRDLTRAAAGVEIRDLQVRGAAGVGLLVAFQAAAPPPRLEAADRPVRADRSPPAGRSVRADRSAPAERPVRAERPAEPTAAAAARTGTASGAKNPGRPRWEPPAKETPQRRSALLPATPLAGAPLPRTAP
ncbi:hypothetical protein AB0I22_30510 [Streptomyces sp. NPDC050610]|uniref:hypothetical protein n=1 Tax=Streptomyces sp. NPDC050610 TaxID=3157097 RepID=UPI0034325147